MNTSPLKIMRHTEFHHEFHDTKKARETAAAEASTISHNKDTGGVCFFQLRHLTYYQLLFCSCALNTDVSFAERRDMEK